MKYFLGIRTDDSGIQVTDSGIVIAQKEVLSALGKRVRELMDKGVAVGDEEIESLLKEIQVERALAGERVE